MNSDISIRGKAWLFGDHVDTDVMIPVKYCTAFTKEELGPYAMAGLDPAFASKIFRGDIIVGGVNFGCGSSRENAPLALLGAGIGAVAASSFGRIFYRNSINVGLPIIECPELVAECRQGDELTLSPLKGEARNERLARNYRVSPCPESIAEIVEAGGLVPYVRKKLCNIG